jgi:hypothetical protein
MTKSGFKHCDKRQGKPRAPVSMAQLAREGRLKPESVAQMVHSGELDARTIAQLRAAKIYPKRVLKSASAENPSDLSQRCLKAKQQFDRAAAAERAARQRLKNAETDLTKAEAKYLEISKLWKERNPSS